MPPTLYSLSCYSAEPAKYFGIIFFCLLPYTLIYLLKKVDKQVSPEALAWYSGTFIRLMGRHGLYICAIATGCRGIFRHIEERFEYNFKDGLSAIDKLVCVIAFAALFGMLIVGIPAMVIMKIEHYPSGSLVCHSPYWSFWHGIQ